MKIDDIIRKCIEIPGVSIKRSEFNAELLMKTKEGKGSMTFFQLFPGLTIAYIFINSPTWAAPNLGEDSFCICERWRYFSHGVFCPKAICLSSPYL